MSLGDGRLEWRLMAAKAAARVFADEAGFPNSILGPGFAELADLISDNPDSATPRDPVDRASNPVGFHFTIGWMGLARWKSSWVLSRCFHLQQCDVPHCLLSL